MSFKIAFYVAFAFVAGWFGGYEAAKLANGLPPSDIGTLALGAGSIALGFVATRWIPHGDRWGGRNLAHVRESWPAGAVDASQDGGP